MPQEPHTGTLEQVLRMLAGMASNDVKFGLEVAAVKALMDVGTAPTYTVKAQDNSTFNVSLQDTTFADLSWISTAFKRVMVTDQMRPLPPYPLIQILGGGRGRIGMGVNAQYEEHGVADWTFPVDVVIITQGDADPPSVQREALVLADAFERLVRRNDFLGGLVELIRAEGPPVPGGTRGAKHGEGSGVLGAAMIRFEVKTLRPTV